MPVETRDRRGALEAQVVLQLSSVSCPESLSTRASVAGLLMNGPNEMAARSRCSGSCATSAVDTDNELSCSRHVSRKGFSMSSVSPLE